MIQRVDTPTEWISAVVVTTKKNGKVRLCIDPKPLNEALHRNHYLLPRDPQLSLLDFRNTPLEGMDSSPAQRIFSRRTRTSLPLASKLLQPPLVPDVGDKLQERKSTPALYYNRGAEVLQPLQEGDVVYVSM